MQLGLGSRLHRADLAHRVRVELLGPHPRPGQGHELLTELGVARDRSGLDEGLELPVPGPALVPGGVRVQVPRERAGATFGAEVGVGAEDDAVGGRGRHVREDGASDAVGLLGSSVVQEEHVDIARVVQLPAAELPHADDGEPHLRLRSSRGRRRGRPRREQRAVDRPSADPRRPRRSWAAIRRYSRRFHRRSARRGSDSATRAAAQESSRSGTSRSTPSAGPSRSGSSRSGSWTSAPTRERDAQAIATSASRNTGSSARSAATSGRASSTRVRPARASDASAEASRASATGARSSTASGSTAGSVSRRVPARACAISLRQMESVIAIDAVQVDPRSTGRAFRHTLVSWGDAPRALGRRPDRCHRR